MDPLAAFSLACNVIRIVDSSIKIVRRCRKVYSDGSSIEDGDLRSMRAQLQSSAQSLDLSIQNCSSPTSVDSSDDQKLLTLSKNVYDTAQVLIIEIAELSLQGTPTKQVAIQPGTLMSIRQTRTIDVICERLEQYHKLLNDEIIVELR